MLLQTHTESVRTQMPPDATMPLSSGISVIRLAADAPGFATLDRFRYDVCMREEGRDARHVQRRLDPSADAAAHHFVARHERDGIVGYARLQIGSAVPAMRIDQLGLAGFATTYGQRFGYISEFMVPGAQRHPEVHAMLMAAMTRFWGQPGQDVEIAFCPAPAHTARLYRRLGFRACSSSFLDPDAGMRIPMYVISGDVAHFESCESPLLPSARRLALAQERVDLLLLLLSVDRVD